MGIVKREGISGASDLYPLTARSEDSSTQEVTYRRCATKDLAIAFSNSNRIAQGINEAVAMTTMEEEEGEDEERKEPVLDVVDSRQMALTETHQNTDRICQGKRRESEVLVHNQQHCLFGATNEAFEDENNDPSSVKNQASDSGPSSLGLCFTQLKRSEPPSRFKAAGLGARGRRLWFERNWNTEARVGGGLPHLQVARLRSQHLSFTQDNTVLSLSSHNSESRRSVYSIGVFYSDTDLCFASSVSDYTSEEDEEENTDGFNWPECSATRSSGRQVTGRRKTSSTGPNVGMARGPTSERNRRRSDQQHRRRRTSGARLTQPQNNGFSDGPTTDVTSPDPHLTRSIESLDNEDEATRHVQDNGGGGVLPDILNSHLPPPYSTLPPTAGGRRLPPPSHPPPPPPPPPIGTCPHSSSRRNCPVSTAAGSGFQARRGHRLRSSVGMAASESDEPKHCCGVMVTQTVSIRWFIVMIAFVGLCCAVVGTVLGALKATGREHLTVSLLMIGVGIVLITVSGIAWRLTSHDAPSCRAMLGLHTATEQEPNRRFVPRVPPYGRPHHPYAAMMYPEFQYRPPPPSYQASMQEYRLRLLLLDRQQQQQQQQQQQPINSFSSGTQPNSSNCTTSPSALSPVSPPPTYRSHSASLHSRPPLSLGDRDYSRPPSYRSRASSAGVLRPSTETLASSGGGGQSSSPVGVTSHSRDPSLSLSFLSHESLFVDSGHSRGVTATPGTTENPAHFFTSPSGESQNSVVAGLSDDSPLAPPQEPHHSWRRIDSTRSAWALRKLHDVNAVTIVQTTDSSQVLNRDTVILSVPGHTPSLERPNPLISSNSPSSGEVQILAHV